MFRYLRTAVVALVAVLTVGMSSAPAQAQDAPPADFSGLATCPELTNSILRLYSAYFLRPPDVDGFKYWLGIYSGPSGGLGTISNVFAVSTEFENTYGTLSNEQFVVLVYGNVFGRVPDAGGLAHWTNALNNGFSRGEVMTSFSESEEYVNQTKTVPPLAGFLTWYDDSVQFQCGRGAGTSSFATLPPSPHYDVVLWSDSTQPMEALWRVYVGDQSTDYARSLPAEHYNIFWSFSFGSAIPTSFAFSSNADPDNFYWTSVVYDEPHSPTRSPYTDGIALRLGQLRDN